MNRVLAIDYGRKRIGLAYSDPSRTIVSHSETIVIKGLKDTMRRLIDFVRANDIGEIVIGYPLKQDGTPGELTEEIERICSRLTERFPEIPIERIDERYTSLLAMRYMHEGGLKVGDDKGRVDSTAASILLEEYINRKGVGE